MLKPIDRRQFLTATGAAMTSGAARGQNVPGKIRTGILGIQHSHLNEKLKAMYNNPAYEVVAVCEPDEDTKKEHGDNPLLSRLRWAGMDEILGDKSIDLIVFEGVVKNA